MMVVARRCGSPVPRTPFLVFLSLLAVSPLLHANTSVFTDTRTCTTGWPTYCSTLSTFGVLTGTTADLLTVGGNWTINGGIGVGTTSELSSSGTNTANGIVDFSDVVSTGTGNCGTVGSGTNFCTNGGTWSGTSPVRAQTLVNAAESNLDNIITKLLTYTSANGTQTALTNAGGTWDVDLGLTGTMKVYRQAGFNSSAAYTFGCGGTACPSDMLVLVYFTSGNVSFRHNISLADGLTSDQLIFFSPAGNLEIGPTAGAVTVNGTFIVGNGSATNRTLTAACSGGNCDAVTVHGRLYNDNGAMTFNSIGGSQDDAGYVVGPAPEPGTWALMGTGIGALLWGGWRKRKAAADAAAQK